MVIATARRLLARGSPVAPDPRALPASGASVERGQQAFGERLGLLGRELALVAVQR